MALVTLAACAEPRSVPRDAYVWQRAWTPPVRAAVTEHGDAFDRIAVLAAEVDRTGVTEVTPPADALRGRRVVAVLRVGVGGERTDLPSVASGAVRRLRDAGIDVRELQIDYDAPSAGLGAYAAWLSEVRDACDVPVTLTALPDWLSRPELPGLLAEADGWTLQVHDLDRPASIDAIAPLLTREEALDAIRRASRLHRPFRVALPTYSYTPRSIRPVRSSGRPPSAGSPGARTSGRARWAPIRGRSRGSWPS